MLDTVSRDGPTSFPAVPQRGPWIGRRTRRDGHTWGAEYFGRPDAAGHLTGGAVQPAKLVAVPLGQHGREVVTRRTPGHPALQLDHLLGGPAVARISDVSVHRAWSVEGPPPSGLADHAPIRFTLSI